MPIASSSPDDPRPHRRRRFGLIVPSRDGGAALIRLAPLPAGAGSVLSCRGDFRPLPGSARCAALTAASGPIGRALGRDPGPVDVVFDRAPDPDRSWEAAVAFAALATRSDLADLVAPDLADVLFVVHGSVDADLVVGTDGVAASESVSIAALADSATRPGRPLVRLDGAAAPTAAPPSPLRLDRTTVARFFADGTEAPKPASKGPIRVAAWGGLALALLGIGWAATALRAGPEAVAPVETPTSPAPPSAAVPPASAHVGVTPGVAGSDEGQPGGAAFRVRLLAAPSGRRCEEVIFGAVAPIATDSALAGASPRLDLFDRPDLCGFDVASSVADRRLDLHVPPNVRPGSVDRWVETSEGRPIAWLRVLFGRGAARASGFAIVAATADGAASATLDVRPPRPRADDAVQ